MKFVLFVEGYTEDKALPKVTNGRELFGRLDPNVAYGKCPRLRELLDVMLTLADKAS